MEFKYCTWFLHFFILAVKTTAMAEQEAQLQDSDNEDGKAGYKPPAVKSLDEIVNQDADDESLQKYKATLLGGAGKDNIFCKYN